MHPLDDARKRNTPWIDVARAVRLLEQENSSNGAIVPPIRMAEGMSGYSANHLRRMLAALDFLEELAQAEPESAEWLGTPRFSIAETLAKLWRQDRDSTLQLLRTRPVLRYEGLYALFHNRVAKGTSPATTGKQAGRRFQNGWLDSIKSAPSQFAPFGPADYSIIRPRSFHRFCKPALLLKAQVSRWPSRWAGIDFVDRSFWDEDAMWRRLMLTATESTFLDLWCIIVASGAKLERDRKSAAECTSEMAHELGLANVCVIPVTDGRSSKVGNEGSSFRSPSPDRRGHWDPPRLSTVLFEYTVATKASGK